MTRANLGDVRRALAERTRDVELSRQAVADFEAVAGVFRDASHPQYYHLAKEQLAVARNHAVEHLDSDAVRHSRATRATA